MRKIVCALFLIYSALQIALSFPSEFYPESWATQKRQIAFQFSRWHLSPGMEIFKGDSDMDLSRELCIVIFGAKDKKYQEIYRTATCDATYFRLIESTFDIFLYRSLAWQYRRSSTGFFHFDYYKLPLGTLACHSPALGNNLFDSAHIVLHLKRRSYADASFNETTVWPVNYDCKRDIEIAPPNTPVNIKRWVKTPDRMIEVNSVF